MGVRLGFVTVGGNPAKGIEAAVDLGIGKIFAGGKFTSWLMLPVAGSRVMRRCRFSIVVPFSLQPAASGHLPLTTR